MVAALCVETGGAYYGLDGVDPWDETRDARTYAGRFEFSGGWRADTDADTGERDAEQHYRDMMRDALYAAVRTK